VLDNVLVPIFFGSNREHNHRIAKTKAIEILTEVGLKDRLHTPAFSLTLSDKKRLELARALGTEPSLIMLDEVMAGLTATEVGQLMDALRSIKKRRSLTILLVEHVMQAVMRFSDRVIVLHHGRMIADGDPTLIVEDPRVIEVYLGSGR